MKTTLSKSIALIAVSLMMVTCTKEKQEFTTITQPNTDDQLIEQVNWFAKAANDLKVGKYLKSGEKMQLDSAISYIGNTLNYKYGFLANRYSKIIEDSLYINLPALPSENKTFIVDALNGFNQVVISVRNIFESYQFENKNIIGFVVQNSGLNTNNQTISLRIIVQIGYDNKTYTSNFNENEQYWWTREGGNCVDLNNIVPGYGAPEILDLKVAAHGWLPSVQPGYRVWYSDPQIIVFDNPMLFPGNNPIDNFCDYKLFRVSELLNYSIITIPAKDFCLGVDPLHPGVHEMQFYCDGLLDVVLNFLTNNPTRSYKSNTTYDQQYSVYYQPLLTYYNVYQLEPHFTHAILHITPDGGGQFPIPIWMD